MQALRLPRLFLFPSGDAAVFKDGLPLDGLPSGKVVVAYRALASSRPTHHDYALAGEGWEVNASTRLDGGLPAGFSEYSGLKTAVIVEVPMQTGGNVEVRLRNGDSSDVFQTYEIPKT